MYWYKLTKPYRAELIKNVTLISDGEVIASASKEAPIPGIVTHCGTKRICNNNVTFYRFCPDIAPDKYWSFAKKWLKRICEETDSVAAIDDAKEINCFSFGIRS